MFQENPNSAMTREADEHSESMDIDILKHGFKSVIKIVPRC
jgi:predicted class III extradiol MEMO1 family dioxygenase